MRKAIIILGVFAVALSSCSSSKLLTRAEQYPLMYSDKPQTIVIMPPINQTTFAEAKDYFYTTLYYPLCEKGYYVFSPFLTQQLFQQESAYDAELFIEGDLSTFREILGADAAMFTIIKDWKKSGLLSQITVEIEYILRSTITGETLYTRGGRIVLDTSVDTGSGLLINMVASAINTAATEKIVAGRKCNVIVLSDLPCGKYSPDYGIDAKYKAGVPYIK